jgi:hypothetical protein
MINQEDPVDPTPAGQIFLQHTQDEPGIDVTFGPRSCALQQQFTLTYQIGNEKKPHDTPSCGEKIRISICCANMALIWGCNLMQLLR